MAVSQKQRVLAASYIGHWAGRLKAGKPSTELHLIESAVNDTVETRCGKHLKASALKNSTGMAIEEYFPEGTDHCQVCANTPAEVAPEPAPPALTTVANTNTTTDTAAGVETDAPFPTPGATTGLAGKPG